MKPDENLLTEIAYLTLLSTEGKISDRQFERLNTLLQAGPLARDYYRNLIHVCLGLEDPEVILKLHEEGTPPCCNSAVLKALADYEKTAPAIPAEPPETPTESPTEPKATTKTVQKVNKVSLAAAVISMAALLFMIAYVEIISRTTGQPVAVIADSIRAQWGPGSAGFRSGDNLSGSYDTLDLRKGIVKIQFTEGTEAILEGPSVFSCISNEKLILHSGHVYVRVPTGSEGFSIWTPTTKIIDLGTEFGVAADTEGITDLHVFKGKASLITTQKNKKVTSLVLTAGQAYRSDPQGAVTEIPLQTTRFVRGFQSARNIIWRSDTLSLNLADVVGGGDGLGTGQIDKGISLTDGRYDSDFTYGDRLGTGQYFPVPELPFVDGVTVPDSKDGPPQISSRGHLFKECPDTTGLYFDEIRNGGPVRMAEGFTFPMTFNGQVFGTAENPLLYMHTNACITFDLEAIRRAFDDFRVAAFRSRCVLLEKSDRIRTEKADLYVLVDGRVAFKRLGFDQNGVALDVDVPLRDSDRFLTLVTTDSDGSIAIDWVGFLEPLLLLESK